MTESEVREWVAITYAVCDAPELAGRIDVAWNRRFTARLGDALWSARRGRGLVRLSVPLWPKAGRAEQEETVVHEVCHVAAACRFGPGHGPRWRALMARCGDPEARRCHTVDRAAILARRAARRVRALCGCPGGVTPGPVQARRLRGGSRYSCSRCGLWIRWPAPAAAVAS